MGSAGYSPALMLVIGSALTVGSLAKRLSVCMRRDIQPSAAKRPNLSHWRPDTVRPHADICQSPAGRPRLGTFLPFSSDVSNGRFCQEPTSSIRPNVSGERRKVGRLLKGESSLRTGFSCSSAFGDLMGRRVAAATGWKTDIARLISADPCLATNRGEAKASTAEPRQIMIVVLATD